MKLENNLRLVSFKDKKIEISFNSDLDKSFIKELSSKLLEWTNKRWIIAFSKEKGFPTLKEQKNKLRADLLKNEKNLIFQKKLKKFFLMLNLIVEKRLNNYDRFFKDFRKSKRAREKNEGKSRKCIKKIEVEGEFRRRLSQSKIKW